MNYDYIIVGGGPAGSTVAYCLQKGGLRCLIVERKKKLGEKTCGGLLPWRGIELLKKIGLDTDVLLQNGAVPIKRFEYINDSDSSIHHYHSGEYGFGITRNLLDQWLLDQSCLMGVDVLLGTSFKEIVRCENGFQVGAHVGSRLIIASGATGFIPVDMRNMLCNQSFGLSLQVAGKSILQNDSAYFFPLEPNNLDYFWIIPNGKQLWNMGIWFQTASTNAVAQFWKYKNKIADKYFINAAAIRPLRGAFCGNTDFSLYLPPDCYGVGDFAGVNQRNTGEGLQYSIGSAISLAHFLESN